MGLISDSAEVYYHRLRLLASNNELLKASRCSNPTIRANALALLMGDKSVNPAPLIREHMFDTAQVFDDYGETKWTIISFMLQSSFHWPNKRTRHIIQKELLQQNPLEVAAYVLLNGDIRVDTFPGYYQTVKKMARFLNTRSFSDNIYWFNGIGALNALASYRYQEDIPLIDSMIYSCLYYAQGQFLPAKAIRNFPAPAFEKYYLDTSANWQRQFKFLRLSDFVTYPYWPQDGLNEFLGLVIEHKSQKSALLLEKIYEMPPQLNYAKLYAWELEESVSNMKEKIAMGIREHYTPHYNKLIKKTAPLYNAYVKEHGEPIFNQSIGNRNSNNEAGESLPRTEKDGYFGAYWGLN